jgi:hypothetical protein
MGAGELKAGCRARAAGGFDVAAGLMVFLLMQRWHGSHNLVEGSFRVAAAPPKTYPVATGLKPVVPGRGKGAFRHACEKNTG